MNYKFSYTSLLFIFLSTIGYSQVTLTNGNCSCQVESSTGVTLVESSGECVLTFSYTGLSNKLYLDDISPSDFTIKGASGNRGSSHTKGKGAVFSGIISNITSEYFNIEVGQNPTVLNPAPGGWPNGGNGGSNGAGAGGGATRIYDNNGILLLVAGAGGGYSGVSFNVNDGYDANGATPGAGYNSSAESGNTTTLPGIDSNDGRGGDTTLRQTGGGGGGYAGGGAGYNTSGANATGGDGGRGSSFYNTNYVNVSTSGFSNGFNTDYNSYTNNSHGSVVLTFSSKGSVKIVASGGTAENSGWTYSNGLITASQNVNINASAIESYLASGDLTIDATSITVSSTIDYTGGSLRSLTLKSDSHIEVDDSIKATSSGELNIILWSDQSATGGNGTTGGYIDLASGVELISNGGKIVLAGGADDGSNDGTASDGIPDGFAWNSISTSHGGILLGPPSGTGSSVNLLSDGGDIVIKGKTSGSVGYPGLLSGENFKINSGIGKIIIDAVAENAHGIELAYEVDANYVITSNSSATPAISISGSTERSGYTGNILLLRGGDYLIESSATSGGGIQITGNHSNTTGNQVIFGDNVSSNNYILSKNGPINIISSGNATGGISFKGNTNFGSTSSITVNGVNSSVNSSNSNITFQTDYYNFTGSTSISSNGVFSINSNSNSFPNNLTWPINNLSVSGDVSGLTIGKPTNTSEVTIGSAATIAGPITLYGGNIAINAPLTATNSTISITSSTSLTDGASGYLIANGLALNGAGTVTLNNVNNNLGTIAAGSSGSRIGALSYFDTDDVAIGTVNPTGIYSSGDIKIETGTGDINLTENISTTSTSSDAIILNAGKSSSAGTSTGGDIIVTGTPTLTTGTNGIVKLFSGSEAQSSGLGAISDNKYFGLDEASSLPSLTTGTTNAIFRETGIASVPQF